MGRKYGNYLCRKPKSRKAFLKTIREERYSKAKCVNRDNRNIHNMESGCNKNSLEDTEMLDLVHDSHKAHIFHESLEFQSVNSEIEVGEIEANKNFSDLNGKEKINSQSANFAMDVHETEDSENLRDLETEIESSQKEEFAITGRRIVDIQYLFKSLKSLKHKGFGCSFFDMELVNERRLGFRSAFTTKCTMCNKKDIVYSEDPDGEQLDATTAAVSGIISTGGSYACLSELTSMLNIPPISSTTFLTYQHKVYKGLKNLAWDEMIAAGQEEVKLAREVGDVDSNGLALITVVVDGAWSKRSYRTNYNALSGVACIIGWRTKKVLYIGVKNKFCSICVRQERSKNITQHECYKNWSGSTTAMEAAVIVDGFKSSVEMHGLIYNKVIGDGDSSVTRKLKDAAPYGPQFVIEKIECRNHILRNYCNKIKEICKKPKVDSTVKMFLNNNLLRFRYGISKAISFRKTENIDKTEKILSLKKDILNSLNHICGDHTSCAEYFCTGNKSNDINVLQKIRNTSIFDDLQQALNRVAMHASSLIEDVDSNIVESFNSLVAKFVAGKRINYSQRDSYMARCEAAVTSFNSNGSLHSRLYKTLKECSPGKYTKQHEERRRKIRSAAYTRRRLFSHTIKRQKLFNKHDSEDADYGTQANIEDMDEETFQRKRQSFLKELEKEVPDEIQHLSMGQRNNTYWKQMRIKRITASNFGKICKLRCTTSTANSVKNLLYQEFCGSIATQYGVENEDRATRDFEEVSGLKVDQCGLFVDKNNPFLAASPDGLIGNDCILEIKCPYSARFTTPTQATKDGIIKFLEVKEGRLKLKDNDNYMYQIQGQLNITSRELCYFVVWTPKGIHIETIKRNTEFWEKHRNKLISFYMNALLPELIDPRKSRGRELRTTFIN